MKLNDYVYSVVLEFLSDHLRLHHEPNSNSMKSSSIHKKLISNKWLPSSTLQSGWLIEWILNKCTQMLGYFNRIDLHRGKKQLHTMIYKVIFTWQIKILEFMFRSSLWMIQTSFCPQVLNQSLMQKERAGERGYVSATRSWHSALPCILC